MFVGTNLIIAWFSLGWCLFASGAVLVCSCICWYPCAYESETLVMIVTATGLAIVGPIALVLLLGVIQATAMIIAVLLIVPGVTYIFIGPLAYSYDWCLGDVEFYDWSMFNGDFRVEDHQHNCCILCQCCDDADDAWDNCDGLCDDGLCFCCQPAVAKCLFWGMICTPCAFCCGQEDKGPPCGFGIIDMRQLWMAYSILSRLGWAALWFSVTFLPMLVVSLVLTPISACFLCPLICMADCSWAPQRAYPFSMMVGTGVFAALYFHFAPEMWLYYQIGISVCVAWLLSLFLAPPLSSEAAIVPLWWGVYSPVAMIMMSDKDYRDIEPELHPFGPIPPVFSFVTEVFENWDD